MYFLRAIRPIANDFLSTIIFVAFYAITGSIRAGIVLGILAHSYYFGTPVKVTGATAKGPTTTVGCGQTGDLD